MGAIGPATVTVIASVIGLAIIAVLVSKNAQTPQVLQGAGSALSNIIGAAVGPVSQSNNFGASGSGSNSSTSLTGPIM
jgi:PRD1 phage membrane DNA delivery